ncbi:MAG: DinB family protein [Planctomycetota bacterium]
MAENPYVQTLHFVKSTFDRSTACLEEEDAAFAPVDGMFTTAQQIAHAAQTIDWFLEGAFRPEGFDLDFEALERKVRAVDSLAAARVGWDEAMARATEKLAATSAKDMEAPLPDGPIMGGQPRATIVDAIADHSTHHRGALTVYARLCGRTPAMPYM